MTDTAPIDVLAAYGEGIIERHEVRALLGLSDDQPLTEEPEAAREKISELEEKLKTEYTRGWDARDKYDNCRPYPWITRPASFINRYA